MRVEPEEVLKQDRIAPERRIENADLQDDLEKEEKDGYAQNGRGQHLNDARRVQAPDEKWKPVPGQAGRPHLVDRHDEIDAREDRREPRDKDGHRKKENGIADRLRVRRVKRPTGVDVAGQHGDQDENGAGKVEVIAREVETGEGDVLGTQMDWQNEVAEERRDRRHQEPEYHHDAVQRKQLIVRVGRHDGLAGCQQLEPNQEGEDTAQEKRDGERDAVQDADPLVIDG